MVAVDKVEEKIEEKVKEGTYKNGWDSLTIIQARLKSLPFYVVPTWNGREKNTFEWPKVIL